MSIPPPHGRNQLIFPGGTKRRQFVVLPNNQNVFGVFEIFLKLSGGHMPGSPLIADLPPGINQNSDDGNEQWEDSCCKFCKCNLDSRIQH